MAIAISLSEDERHRLIQMKTDVLDLIVGHARLRTGEPDEETKARLIAARAGARDRLDWDFALYLADRLGEDALRGAVEEITPPSARASIEALVKREGGMIPLVRNRIGLMSSAADATVLESDSVGCALGITAVVVGVVANGILGGIVAVAGIVIAAMEC